MASTMGEVNVNISVQYRDTLGHINSYAKNPFTSKDVADIKKELIHNIQNRGSDENSGVPRNMALIGTLVTGKRTPPPYHTYPSRTRGELERSSDVVRRTPNTLSIFSTSQHASVLETGRGVVTAPEGKMLAFRGYYPNRKILRDILRSRIPKRLSERQKASRWGAQGNEQFVQNLMDSYAAQAYGSHAHKEKRRGKLAQIYANPDRYARSRGIEPTSRRYKDKNGKAYEYGIFTVLTKRVRAVQPYGVFSKTALWAKRTMIDNVKKRIGRLGSIKSGTKVIKWQ